MDTHSTTAAEASGSQQFPNPALWLGLRPLELIGLCACSLFILVASYASWWSISVSEAWGFTTGGICVWLVVREHLWNWPIGLANNVFFFILFLGGRLYADMGLQILYFGLGIYGWWNWMKGGNNRTALKISLTRRTEWMLLAIFIPLCSYGLYKILVEVNDASAWWDALTTVLSLAAQYLLCCKRLENWFFWMAADLTYVPLYLSRNLPLTAMLYAVFFIMCLTGVKTWIHSMKTQ